MTHSKTPWRYAEHEEPANNGDDNEYIYNYWIVDEDGKHILSNLSDYHISKPEDLNHIVQCVNSYENLVEALEAVKKHGLETEFSAIDDIIKVQNMIDAALSKAKA